MLSPATIVSFHLGCLSTETIIAGDEISYQKEIEYNIANNVIFIL